MINNNNLVQRNHAFTFCYLSFPELVIPVNYLKFYFCYKFCLWLLKVEVFVVVDSQYVDFKKSVGIIMNVSVHVYLKAVS